MASNQRSVHPCTRTRIRRRYPRCFISHHLGIIIQSRLPALLHSHLLLLLLLPLLLPARRRSVAAAYFGPTHCIKPGTSAAAALTSSVVASASSTSSSAVAANTKIMGYSTYNHLLFDLISLSDDFRSGRPIPDERLTFTLCPNRVIDLDESTLPLGYLPIDVPRTTLRCGHDGSRSNRCVVRGGGKRDSQSTTWNTDRERSFKRNEFGILGGGGDDDEDDDIAQIYVYGDTAYEITLKGLTMDNSVTEEEATLYREYVARYSGGRRAESDNDDDDTGGNNVSGHRGGRRTSSRYLDAMAKQLDAIESELNAAGAGNRRSGAAQPAQRFASIAVRGRGSGDDAGPRIITVEDCEFTHHRGHAILVSPGIRGPEIPMAPVFNRTGATSSPMQPSSTESTSPLGQSIANDPAAGSSSSSSSSGTGTRTNRRTLNSLDDGAKYIPADGQITYYDRAADNRDNIDGHRVKIIDSDFVNNNIASDTVAGLVASAYSLTIGNCLFEQNSARAMVFAYNREAAVENTMFVENVANVSTVIMQTPKGQGGSKGASSSSSSSSSSKATNVDNHAATAAAAENDDVAPPSADDDASHVVRRCCFLGSSVGMSNVLVTDAGYYAQRDNFGQGTEYAWASKCEDGAAEKVGGDCATNANCTGRCVPFAGEECAADRVATSNEYSYESFTNDGCSFRLGGGGRWRSGLGAMMLLVLFPLISYL